MPAPAQFNLFTGDGGGFGYAFGNNGLFASYELAPLNEKLGAYFGTTEGVLVVNNHVFDNRVFVDATTGAQECPRRRFGDAQGTASWR